MSPIVTQGVTLGWLVFAPLVRREIASESA
jgi:hypothetical protein